MQLQRWFKKCGLVLMCVLLMSACAQKGLIETTDLSREEVRSIKADLKLEMIAPPKSKMLEENLITPIKVEPFKIQGEGNQEFASLINDKIVARLGETGYVQVVNTGGAAKLTGTLRLDSVEKFQETGSSIGLEDDDGQELESKESGLTASKVGEGLLNTFNDAMNVAVISGGSTSPNNVPVKTTTVKRMSAVINYQLLQGDRIIASGDIKKELNEKQSAFMLTQVQTAPLIQKSSKLSSDSQMTNKLLDILADSVVAEISPHPDLFPFNWLSDSGCKDDETFELGLKYAKQDLDSEASDIWKKMEVAADGKCRAALLYNLGLLKLKVDPKSRINQKEAYDMFTEADALNRGHGVIMPAVRKLKKIAFTKFQAIDPSLRSLSATTFGHYRLFVNTEPKDSTVSILNIRTRYESGVELKPGKYKVKVSAPGYRSKTKNVVITDHDVTVDIEL